MSAGTAAMTYARALLGAAGADASAVRDDLLNVVIAMRDEPAPWQALLSPSVSSSRQYEALNVALAAGNDTTRRFMRVLAEHRRLDMIAEITEEFERLVREQQGELDVHVTTAVSLSTDLRTKLEERLSATTGRQVRLHTSIDPQIIGGLVVRHGDVLIDGSVRGRIDELRLRLMRTSLK